MRILNHLELIALTVGFACICLALAAVEWRLGLAAFGLGLIVSAIDRPRTRR